MAVKYRKLRITWSAAWGVAVLLLMALWIRSYWRKDSLTRSGERAIFAIESLRGEITLASAAEIDSLGGTKVGFDFQSTEANHELTSNNKSFSLIRGPWDEDAELQFPHWCSVVFLSLFTLLPWIPLPRRFSLRTLLIATMLVAVGVGVIVWLR